MQREPGMRCAEARTAVSAMLDGEPPGESSEQVSERVDAHLAGCPACAAWRADADAVSRAVVAGRPDAPDLTGRVLAAVAADRARRARAAAEAGRRQVLRWALGISAVAQLLLALPTLLAGLDGASVHLSREVASFDVAVATGFLVAAVRPGYARALLPVGMALSGLLLVTSAADILGGTAALAHEANHLLTVVQAGLLWALARPRGGDRAASTSPARAA